MAARQVPQSVIDSYAGARLVALLIPNGKIKTVACGMAIRRITTAAIARVLTPIASHLSPYQFPTGTFAGPEQLHKIAATLLDTNHHASLLSLDVTGAQCFEDDALPFVPDRVESAYHSGAVVASMEVL